MAVTESLSPTVHPKWEARSPTRAVSTPIAAMLVMKHAQPPRQSATQFKMDNNVWRSKLWHVNVDAVFSETAYFMTFFSSCSELSHGSVDEA
ncbi:hypothetical protein CDAR_72421 [Caerostris darwini]|uniref:Uncharacterized protein n=1 Tax=Caerostris darwini TaxID=1538125 RepID=A0AAV4MPW3_9ARAC|nr:hypothetical protein CDAR_72421 [Caerostris darwini]